MRRALIAHALVTPLIGVVYFYPTYSSRLLFLGFPWAITAPLFMLMLAILLRGRQGESAVQPPRERPAAAPVAASEAAEPHAVA